MGDVVDEGVEMGEGEATARRCSLLGRLFFSWFDRYVAKGKAKALTADDIPVLEEEFRYASECGDYEHPDQTAK